MNAACIKIGKEFKNWVAGDVLEFHSDTHKYTSLDLETFDIKIISGAEFERVRKEIRDYNVQLTAIGALPTGIPFAGTKTTIRHYIEDGVLKWRTIT